MRQTTSSVSFIVIFMLAATAACAGGRGATSVEAAAPGAESASADQDRGVTPASFIQVEGADLNAKPRKRDRVET